MKNIINQTNQMPSDRHSMMSNNGGFTLIEVLVASTIFVVVIGMSIGSFTSSAKIKSQNQAIRQTSQTGMYVMESIARDIKLADGEQEFSLNADEDLLIINYTHEEVMYSSSYEYVYDSQTERGTILYSDNRTGVENEDLLETNMSIEAIEEEAGQIFFTDPYFDLSAAEVQSNLEIKFNIKQIDSDRLAEMSDQTIQTSITTRNYPGFN